MKVEVTAPEAICTPEEAVEPFGLVIFGASGDLTARKLIPDLYDLYTNSCFPESFYIFGCARTSMNDKALRQKLEEAMQDTGRDLSRWEDFAGRIYYQPVVYDAAPYYESLAQNLKKLDEKYRTGGNRLFYLAVPPTQYVPIAANVGRAGIAREERGGWTRIVVKSALELNSALQEHFAEEQIFRIDHYLAKETVQNLLVFRLANSIFEPVWNRDHIAQVHITAAETLGVENRAGYYEQAGVIRDMFQNHMLQLLVLTAMEPPAVFSADRVRDEKIKVFRSLRPFSTDNPYQNLALGQYQGYRQEPGVDPGSLTPTWARLKAFIDNRRWQGVPFTLTSGKRLSEKRTEIVIEFKELPHSLFGSQSSNRLTIGIHPDEVIDLVFVTKVPGPEIRMQPVTMHFDYNQGLPGPRLDAYAKVLLDCLRGDQLLFWHQKGVEHSWSYLTPILERCENCPEREERLKIYPAGSDVE
jgi:glucose-6-phosphate 1-dehydrogenase